MPKEQIPRYKPKATWSPAEFLNAQHGGDPPETDEYTEARRTALEDAGLEDDTEVTDPNEMTSQQHLKKIQGG
jgi:hypothetical protein